MEYTDYYTEEYNEKFNISIVQEDEFSELDYNEDPLVRVIASLLLFIFVLFGIFGNLAIIHIVGNKWNFQTPLNIFIATIAFADVLQTIHITVLAVSHMFFGEFIYDEDTCKILNFIELIAPVISMLSIVAALMLLQFGVVGIKIAASAVGMIYLLALPMAVISAQFSTILEFPHKGENLHHCFKTFPSATFERTFFVTEKFLILELPATCLVIYFFLWIISTFTNKSILRGFVYDKLLILMGLISILAWGVMLNISLVIADFKIIYIVMFMANTLVGLSIVVKPLLYVWMHEGLRRELQKIVGWKSREPENVQFF